MTEGMKDGVRVEATEYSDGGIQLRCLGGGRSM